MASTQDNPNLVAGQTVKPFRVIKVSGVSWNGIHASGATDVVVGVTDGSLKSVASFDHANAGDPLHLQPGDVVAIELKVGSTVSAGDGCIPDTNGVIAGAGQGHYRQFIALEGGSGPDVIWCVRADPSIPKP